MILIYTCKPRLNKALQLYDMLWNMEERIYIVYGDTLEEEYKIDGKFLVLNVGDYYEDLTQKTMKMFQVVEKVFPGEYVIKMDEDIIPCVSDLKKKIAYLNSTNNKYAGRAVKPGEHMTKCHYGKVNDKTLNVPMLCKAASYAGGSMYYIGASTVPLLHNLNGFCEDNAVGYKLNAHGIYPTFIELYTNQFTTCTSFENRRNVKTIYVKLNSRLGNQLFQVASAYGLAKKHSRILILVSTQNLYTKTFFKDFNIIHPDNLPSMRHYDETDKQCFKYNESIISDDDVCINGNLQVEKYFSHCKPEILNFFKKEIAPLNAYFIHVRRGDYVNNSWYQLDYDTYFKKAIDYLGEDSHYYICSDDIDYCKKYKLFEPLQKTFVEDTDINTLYLMSSCVLGGICSNSTFSWWGSYLNTNPNKKVIFPSTWFNNGQDNDVYPENAIII